MENRQPVGTLEGIAMAVQRVCDFVWYRSCWYSVRVGSY